MATEAWYGSEVGSLRTDSGALSAVSWAAVLAGAAAAAAISLILLVLGTGLGLAAMSPWSGEGAQAETLGVTGIVWIAFTQLVAAGLGGYLAGRLRTRWRDTAADEVHFRDTAHGLLSWAVATLFTAALLGSAVTAVLGTGVKAVSTVAAGGTAAAVAGAAGLAGGGDGDGTMGDRPARGPRGARGDGGFDLGYYLDAMTRRDAASATAGATAATATATTAAPAVTGGTAGANPNTWRNVPDLATANTQAELTRLVMHAWRQDGTLSADDTRQAGALVAQRTGLSQADAEKRVSDVMQRARTDAQAAQTKAREAADAARKVAMQTALWMFVALLLGAFASSCLATLGGRQRDRIE